MTGGLTRHGAIRPAWVLCNMNRDVWRAHPYVIWVTRYWKCNSGRRPLRSPCVLAASQPQMKTRRATLPRVTLFWIPSKPPDKEKPRILGLFHDSLVIVSPLFAPLSGKHLDRALMQQKSGCILECIELGKRPPASHQTSNDEQTQALQACSREASEAKPG